jgi:hypothetical protein
MPLAALIALASPDELAEAKRIAFPKKGTLALVIAKQMNPFIVLTEAQEQELRGVSDKTLKGYKDDNMLPPIA